MTAPAHTTVAGKWLPEAQFRERHEALVNGDADAILDALIAIDDRDDALVRFLLSVRECPSRVWGALGGRSALRGQPRFSLRNFTLLERTETTLVLGLVGRFWRLDFGLETIADAAAFRRFGKPRTARLVMTFDVHPNDERSASLRSASLITETYVHCPDRTSFILFAMYWAGIRAASGWIRRRMLRQVQCKSNARNAERMTTEEKTKF